MRRIKLVFAALVVLVAAFVAFSGPVMAQEDPNCGNARGDLIRCDGDLYAPYSSDDDYYDNDYSPFYNDYPYPFYNDYYDYSDYPYLFDYGYGYYDEEVYEEVQEAQEEYLEDLADIYEEYHYW
jgi:hypothetical protein